MLCYWPDSIILLLLLLLYRCKHTEIVENEIMNNNNHYNDHYYIFVRELVLKIKRRKSAISHFIIGCQPFCAWPIKPF